MSAIAAFVFSQRYSLGAIALGVFVVAGWSFVAHLTGWSVDQLIMGSTLYLAARAYLKTGGEQ